MGFNIIDCVLFTEIANRCSLSQKNMQSYCTDDDNEVIKINQLIENKEYKIDIESDAECITFNQIKKPNILHVVFIGSNSCKDWIVDIDFIPIKLNMNASLTEDCLLNHNHSDFKIHRGIHYQFMQLYSYLKNKIKDFLDNSNFLEHEIIISGHSLGGGLAIISAIYFHHLLIELKKPHVKIKVITIGAPRVLNKNLAEWYNNHLAKNTWRIINHYDSIPNLPSNGKLFEYTHVDSIIIYIKNDSILNEIPKRFLIDRIKSLYYNFETHSINIYIENLKKFKILNFTKIC